MFAKKPLESSDIPFPLWGIVIDGQLVLTGRSPALTVANVYKVAMKHNATHVILSYENIGDFLRKNEENLAGNKIYASRDGRIIPVAHFERLSARNFYAWNTLGEWKQCEE